MTTAQPTAVRTARELRPPEPLRLKTSLPEIFLGGSIEQGKAAEWQGVFLQRCADLEVLFLNPRREFWDPTWRQDRDDPNLNFQVNWEQDGLARADLTVFYFDPQTLAPVTLLEFGQLCASGRIMVCCPHGYWRKGNVDIVCERNGIPMAKDLDELIAMTRLWIRSFEASRLGQPQSARK